MLSVLARQGLIERRPHPTHGRILQITLSAEGERRLEAAIERDFTAEEVATVKRWLVTAAARLERWPARRSGGENEATP